MFWKCFFIQISGDVLVAVGRKRKCLLPSEESLDRVGGLKYKNEGLAKRRSWVRARGGEEKELSVVEIP